MATKSRLNRHFYRILLLFAIIVIVQFASRQSTVADAHYHEHSHDEPAHYKYSRQANQEQPDHGHHHGHSHEDDIHDDHHGHYHDHGHTHEHHGHTHEHHDHGHTHEHHQPPPTPSNTKKTTGGCQKPTTTTDKATAYDKNGYFAFMNQPVYNLWVYAIGSTLLISAAPFFILFFIPIQTNTPENGPLLKVLLSFASGGLLGDAFLHLIPHAQLAHGGGSHSHSHSHAAGEHHEPHDMFVGFWVLCGLITFLFVEKVVRIAKGEGAVGHGHGHSHAPVPISPPKKESTIRKRRKSAKDSDDEESDDDEETEDQIEHDVQQPTMKVAGYLNLAADFAHNFTDGLAVGASYLAGNSIGIVTTVTVLLHEVPHEIGDFAILVQSGCSKRKAMMMQLVTALGALLGCVISIWTSDPSGLAETAAASWVLPFTAGGFIYIATVAVIPELLENSEFGQSVKEIVAILVGIALMYGIAFFE